MNQEKTFVLRHVVAKERAMAHIAVQRVVVDQPLEVVVRPHDPVRSPEQNRRYWAMLGDVARTVIYGGAKFPALVWHEHFKRQFLPVDTVALPGGPAMVITTSTTELRVREFAHYMGEVEAYAADDLGATFSADALSLFDEWRARRAA